MGRLHLFEIEDQTWCPAVLRDAGTAYLTRFVEQFHMLDGAADPIRALVASGGSHRVVDLGSGAGGPARLLLGLVDDDVTVLCTDLFPSEPALAYAASLAPPGRFAWHREPVDARDVPAELDGPRTQFNAIHHLPPAGVPFAVLAMVPFLRPFRWEWLLFTYVIPLIPLLVLWDGMVSCLRVYSPDELRELVNGLDGFEWDIGTFPLPFPGYGTYLVGKPTGDRG